MLRPLYDFVFIRKDPAESQIGRFLLPEQAKQKSNRGIVVAVGPGNFKKGTTERIPCEVKVGDRVIWNEWRGEEFEAEGEKLMVIHDDEIEAVELQ